MFACLELHITKTVVPSDKKVPLTVILFSAWDKSRGPGANWSKLEHIYTTLAKPSVSFYFSLVFLVSGAPFEASYKTSFASVQWWVKQN